ncbi:MAG: TlpA family protein disulfide reductase [Geovibrio sp.]|jgi:thiol-disulfide isomerase/thioredoxin|uniref:TlpA family protein disulfide reductase n=1 Tax=Geovibrio ferrireducens TaxID=46201 RepID=UPI00224612CD|nr:TlpA disulfide reductase family protein [Geovibrio ferrireducens]MCD8569515.1 TlpA family protein disulfide reductase [Geovibrio sp.]
MKIKVLLFAALLMVFAACSRQETGGSENSVSVDSIETLKSGAMARIKEEHQGKVLLVNFFASWCPPCRGETPDFVKVYGEEKERFSIVALSTDADKKDLAKYISEFGVNYPVYMADQSLSMEFGISTIPTSIIYAPDGKLVDIIVGSIPEKDLKNIINKLSAN